MNLFTNHRKVDIVKKKTKHRQRNPLFSLLPSLQCKGDIQLKKKGHTITKVAPGSIGEELELEPGDILLTIDGDEIEDIFDYNYMTDS